MINYNFREKKEEEEEWDEDEEKEDEDAGVKDLFSSLHWTFMIIEVPKLQQLILFAE